MCLQGASATGRVLREFTGKPVRALIVWEPVLPTDWAAPSTAALRRTAGTRAIQFWDKGRLISRVLGEHDERSIVWDHVAVYPAGAVWDKLPPPALYEGGPVVKVEGPFRDALVRALAGGGDRGMFN